jgi:hypothetical protein
MPSAVGHVSTLHRPDRDGAGMAVVDGTVDPGYDFDIEIFEGAT